MFYCTHCCRNIVALESQDDPMGDESYEYCPYCKNDMFLRHGSGPEESITIAPPPACRAPFTFNRDDWEAKRQQSADTETAAINSYIAAHATGAADPQQQYFETFKK